MWNVIGHLMGVLDEVRPYDTANAKALLDTIKRRRFMASPEGQHMTRALLVLLDQLTPTQVFDQTIPPLIRHLIGDTDRRSAARTASDLRGELEQLARIADWFYVRVVGRPGRVTALRLESGLRISGANC